MKGKSFSAEAVFDVLTGVTQWARGDERAPHKPLLLLMTLARVQRGEPGVAAFEEVEPQLRDLLLDFGPRRKSVHPEYPFWRLQNDDGGFWIIPEAERAIAMRGDRARTGDVPKGVLLKAHATGGFCPEVDAVLRKDPSLVNRIVTKLLEDNFEPSMHDDILDAVGFPWVQLSDNKRRVRDPQFRSLILRAYEHRCAICGWDGRLGHTDLALEAAHVRWHAAGGPDDVENGLALCTLHHKVFDRGAISLDGEWRVLVSEDVHGQTGLDELLLRYRGQAIRSPQSSYRRPARVHTRWHVREVFRGPARTG